MKATARITVTLADGTAHTLTVARMPKHWKSALLQALPFGTDTFGCSFSRELVTR